MKAVMINGWGQVHDSLSLALPREFNNVSHLDYATFSGWDAFLENLPKRQRVDLLIGWSLGGQIAARLVEKRIFLPKLLVLIATPFQFVADEKIPYAMNPVMLHTFKSSFHLIPGETLKRFALMIAQHDSNMKKIVENLGIEGDSGHHWLEWLDEIGNFTCANMDFLGFPKTLIIHGDGDMVVDSRQAALFAEAIAGARLKIFKACGHAPHLHDPAKVKALIRKAAGL